MSNLLDTSEDTRELQARCRMLYSSVFIIFLIFFIRLWFLQVISGTELRLFSEKNISKKTVVAAPRGIFFDRDGQVLVDNLPGSEATITPQYLQTPEATYQAIAQVLKISPQQIAIDVQKSKKKNGPFEAVKVAENLTLEQIFQLRLLQIDHPGLNINEIILRSYPLKENGAQLFGFVGEVTKSQIPVLNKKYKDIRFKQGDRIGKRGLEKYLDEEIRGRDGVQHFGVDARGRGAEFMSSDLLDSIKKFNANPVAGHNVQLTIDRDIQAAAEKAFSGAGRIGGLVAMKTNGEVLAWVSSPSFDPNSFSFGVSPQIWSQLINDSFNPLTDKVIQYHAAPGSTFKAIVALAALSEKVASPYTTHFCPGSIKFGTRPYHCASRGGHGTVNMYQAIERSCNIYFYKLAMAMDIDTIAKYAFALGLGKPTGIDLNGEIPGHIPTKKWKEDTIGEPWQAGENLSNAIGQGFMLTTPLQMASAYAAIANEGLLYRPFIVKKIFDTQNNIIKEFFPTLIRDSSQKDGPAQITKENFKHVKKGLWMVANGDSGTAHFWKLPGVEFAGKTGTGQLFNFASVDQVYSKCEAKPIKQRNHGWFVSYAPANNPEIVIAALAEHSCHGNTGAVPVARDIYQAYFQKYHPEMLKVNIKGAKAAVIKPPAPEIPTEVED